MLEEESSKQDKAFKVFLVVVLKILEAIGYLGLLVVLIIVASAIWRSGWKELPGMIWPALAACVILVGSIWGAKLLRKLVV
ncbi:MAG: hypothetical protein JW896_01865 [Deltaproteobacteria bacterium]|nr:hypothetical protein [Deltaproteobacteria bacterium]